MNYRLCRLTILILLILFSATFAFADLATGTIAPDFELTDMNGQKVKLSDYKGHPFVLKLATTWCPSCKQQSAELAKAQGFLVASKIPVVEVFVDDTAAEVRKYMEKYPLPGEKSTVILDDGQVYKAYNVYLIPRLLIIDKDFKVKRDGSVIEAAVFKPILESLL